MPNEAQSFDIVVLGAGTGGYAAAFRAGQLGLKVALVDDRLEGIGGTCLHVGCIPTKAMLESADLYERIRNAAELGIRVDTVSVDAAAIAARRDQVVKRLVKGLGSLVRKNNVEYVRGRGRLEGPQQVRVATTDAEGNSAGEAILRARYVILATGSRVKSLPGLVPDGTRIVTSDDVLASTSVPRSIVVVGAGAVGVEFASYYHDLGSEVTLLEYLPAIVPLEDAEVSSEMERAFKRRGIKVMTSARFDPAAVVADEDGIRLMVGREGQEPAELRAEPLLVATGRAANTEDVGLETTRAVVDRGLVKVDGEMRTADPHLYAIGDIIGGLWLAHVAAHEGIAAVHAIAGREVEPVDYVKMPRATYSRPQVASIGLTSAECEARGLLTRVGKFPFQASGKAIINGDTSGFVKVIADASTDEVLGVHMIGAHVTELIAEASAALLLEATAWELGSAVHPHPTLSEALGEAAMAVDGKSINF
ncbi:MAG TPA: dihydrolipoyl dehydrogenase [Candidatus Limnocylindrales bacterium]|nr:dihydrolipoyl dehydrogenase [Candidatus Limnocylindrales bacterium]